LFNVMFFKQQAWWLVAYLAGGAIKSKALNAKGIYKTEPRSIMLAAHK
jgi:hypothetical protein